MLFQSANSNADWAIQQTVAMLDELVAPWGGVFGAASRLVTPIPARKSRDYLDLPPLRL